MNFKDCVLECCQNRELVSNYNRLTGCNVLSNIYDNRVPIVKMIDEATEYQKILDEKSHEDIQGFIDFIYWYIWYPLIMENESGLFKWKLKGKTQKNLKSSFLITSR